MRETAALSLDSEDLKVQRSKLESESPRERAAAAAGLARYGTSAAAYEGLAGDVAKLLDDPNADVRAAACGVLAEMGEPAAPFAGRLLALLGDGSPAVHRAAVAALGAVGSASSGEGSDVGRALAEELRKEGSAQALAVQSLAAIGAEPYAAEVAALLDSQRLEVRRAALRCLGTMEPMAAAPHAAAVAEALEEPLARAAAFPALAHLGPAAAEHLQEILPFLEDGDCATRRAAAVTLGALAASVDQCYVDQVAELIGHHNPSIRASGAMALGELGEQVAGEYAQAVKELLYDDQQWEDLDAAPPALEADMFGRPPLMQQLRGPWLSKPCCAAAFALGKLGSRGKEHIVTLAKQFVKSDDPDFKVACIEALAEMGEKGAEYCNYIARCVKERGAPAHVRAAALLALGELVHQAQPNQGDGGEWLTGERVHGSLARIAEALADPDPDLRLCAVHALGTAGPRAEGQAAQLAGLLESRSDRLLAAVLRALGAIGAPAADHADKVAALLEDARMPVRLHAVQAVGAMGAKEHAHKLVIHLRDPACEVRAAAALALGRMGMANSAVGIARLLVDPLASVRRAACEGLGSFAASAQNLPEGLTGQLSVALEDDTTSVRAAALEAWDRLKSLPKA